MDPRELAHSRGVEVRDHNISFDGSSTTVATFQRREQASETPRACVLYIHGGGFNHGDRYTDIDELVRIVASDGVVGVSLDYRLAPEHPFPGALDDCDSALGWIIENAPSLNVNPNRIVIMGVSAGGGLAASLALRVSARWQDHLAGLLLSCPMLDDRTKQGSDPVGTTRTWSYKDNEAAWEKYLGRTNPTADSVPARALDLSGFPPTFIDVGTDDIFYDEDLRFAARLRECGVLVEAHTWNLGYHGFDLLEPDSPMAIQAARVRLTWIRSRISG